MTTQTVDASVELTDIENQQPAKNASVVKPAPAEGAPMPVNCEEQNAVPTAKDPVEEQVNKMIALNMEVLDNSTQQRVSSRGMDVKAFNRSLANFRKSMVKNMLHSSYQAVENTFAEQQRLQEDSLRKDLEAAQKARESLRRQLERGQEMEEVQKAAMNYETALRHAANDDEDMAKKLLTMFASMHHAKAKYNRSLQFRLDGRYGYATKEDW